MSRRPAFLLKVDLHHEEKHDDVLEPTVSKINSHFSQHSKEKYIMICHHFAAGLGLHLCIASVRADE